MSDLLTLLWKEYRTNAHMIVIGCSVLLLPAVLSFSMIYANARDGARFLDILASGLIFGSLTGLVASQIVILCLGGFLIGGERSTRTFEFLFNQPVSRSQIVTSKLIFAGLWTLAIWTLGGLCLLTGLQLLEPGNGPNMDGLGVEFFVEVAATGAMLFGASWLASNKFESALLSIAIGALATTLVFLLLQMLVSKLDIPIKIADYDWTRIITFSILSICSIAMGARMFVSRKAP